MKVLFVYSGGSVPAKGRSLPVQALDFKVHEDSKAWLRDTSHKTGGVGMSAIITLLLLDWCGINPLFQQEKQAT